MLRFFLVSIYAACFVRADDLETVRLNALTLFGWPSPSSLPSVVAEAASFQKTLNSTTFRWPDIDYHDPSDRANWRSFVHVGRVVTLVQALTTPGSSVFEDAALTIAAHGALGAWIFAEKPFVNDNWWYGWIGEPLSLGQCFLLLGVNRTSLAEQTALSSFSYNAAYWINSYGGGANLVWMIQAELYRGLATRNLTAVSQGFNTMWADVTVKSPSINGQGIMPDGAYHFHGQQPLNYAYGADWLSDILLFHTAANGTSFDLPFAAVDLLATFIAEGNAHMSFGGTYFDYSLTGRGIDRPGSSFKIPFATAPMRSIAKATTLPAIAGAIEAWCDLIDGVSEAPPLVGARYYWTSDFFTIHRPTWGASLKAHGNNTHWSVVGGECDNGENMKGEHEGAGVLSVYNISAGGSEYVTRAGDNNAIFPLWDWSGMNGITVDHAAPLEKCAAGDVWPVINTNFVGATCDGLYGVFAMDTATHSLTARRSWFFFDNIILALAQSITDASQTSNPRTALASRLLAQPVGDSLREVVIQFANGSTVALPDGAYTYGVKEIDWFASGGNGYIPAAVVSSVTPASFGISVGTVDGDWSSIGAFNGTSQNRVLASWLDHGSNGVVNESYAYAIFPSAVASEMPALAASLGGVDRSCITNGLGVQGATDTATNVTMAVFWEATGGVYGPCASNGGLSVSVTTPAILLIREEGGAMAVSVSSPTLSAPSVAYITIGGRGILTGDGCSPAPGGGDATLFSITYPIGIDNTGKTVTIVCS